MIRLLKIQTNVNAKRLNSLRVILPEKVTEIMIVMKRLEKPACLFSISIQNIKLLDFRQFTSLKSHIVVSLSSQNWLLSRTGSSRNLLSTGLPICVFVISAGDWVSPLVYQSVFDFRKRRRKALSYPGEGAGGGGKAEKGWGCSSSGLGV